MLPRTRVEPLLTIDDLVAIPEDGNIYELIEGELIVARAPSITHQLASLNLSVLIKNYLDRTAVGVLIPTPGLIFGEYDSVIPDLVFIKRERYNQIVTGIHITGGAPDLVIEIASPGAENSRRDRLVKRQTYGKFGVQEYWIVDTTLRHVEVSRLRDGVLAEAEKLSEHQELTTDLLPGFSCAVREIFKF